MKPQAQYHLEPQTGTAFRLAAGQVLRIIDPQGEQVSDVVAFGASDVGIWLSSGRTFDYNNTIYLTTGHVLYANNSEPMFTILEDNVGKHDFLYTPCSAEMFKKLRGQSEHPSCFGNLAQSLAPFGVAPHTIPTTFNVFMNVDILPSGELSIGPPLSRPGDYLELRAEMDLLVGVTACSSEHTNNGIVKPIDVQVWS